MSRSISPQARLVADLVADAGSAPNAHGFRRAVLARLERAIGFDSAIFVPLAGVNAPAGEPTLVNKEAYRHLFQRYALDPSRYAPDLGRLADAAARNRGGYVDTEVLSSKERRERLFYREVVAP